eukprot:7003874-Alexandrium_andersonii.AAC.1
MRRVAVTPRVNAASTACAQLHHASPEDGKPSAPQLQLGTHTAPPCCAQPNWARERADSTRNSRGR